MSLSISEVKFLREQQALNLAARDNPLIQLAKDQLTAILAQLPVGEQFPFRDYMSMNSHFNRTFGIQRFVNFNSQYPGKKF